MKELACIATVLLFLFSWNIGVAQECPAPQSATLAVIHVRREEYHIASLESRLIRLLTDYSVIDGGSGLLEVPRERQIQKALFDSCGLPILLS
jgi:hypothetical protein